MLGPVYSAIERDLVAIPLSKNKWPVRSLLAMNHGARARHNIRQATATIRKALLL